MCTIIGKCAKFFIQPLRRQSEMRLVDTSGEISISLLICLFLLTFPLSVNAYNPCGDLQNAYGPFDYFDPATHGRAPGSKNRIHVVERVHFSSSVQRLKGRTSSLMGDLDYTLRAIPNHPRALLAVSKLERRVGRLPQEPNNTWLRTADCYFDRALRLTPQNPIVHMIYGIHLHAINDLKKALKHYKIAERLNPESAELAYNMGLLYVDLKQYENAKKYAKQAYARDYPLAGLKNMLAEVGQWP